MLSNKLFATGLTYLKAFYKNWDFTIGKEPFMSVWYNYMKYMEDARFIILINLYTKNNIYPPRSPKEIVGNSGKTAMWLLEYDIDYDLLPFNPLIDVSNREEIE